MTAITDYAHLDLERATRCGFPEVVFGEGKTPDQVCSIARALLDEHGIALITRASAEQADVLRTYTSDACYFEQSRILFVDHREDGVLPAGIGTDHSPVTVDDLLRVGGNGHVVVCCAGTSDVGVAHEAALTARLMGSRVSLLTDIGIAGLHRTLTHHDLLRSARVLVVVAGMEGALPSLIAGLVDVPVIAVPTSVGYGASFKGIAALLGMLNSCAGGVSVVNIDNGFGAGQIADRINRPPVRLAMMDSVATREPPTESKIPTRVDVS